jgi:hypothetical protein
MGILPVNLNLRHPKAGSDPEADPNPPISSLHRALGAVLEYSLIELRRPYDFIR